jgi:hypothetical protein
MGRNVLCLVLAALIALAMGVTPAVATTLDGVTSLTKWSAASLAVWATGTSFPITH